jgi:hypothetical protein
LCAAALSAANARIASLEAELKASQKAYDVATAAKAIAEKSQKSSPLLPKVSSSTCLLCSSPVALV